MTKRKTPTRSHAWSSQDAKKCRGGMFNARDGKGWQKAKSTLSVEASEARDMRALQRQAAHRAFKRAEAMRPERPRGEVIHCEQEGDCAKSPSRQP